MSELTLEKHDNRVIGITMAICFVLQLVLAPNIVIGDARPNFLLIAVVCVAIFKGSRTGCIAGCVAGVVLDLISTGPMGAGLILLSIVGFAVGRVAKGILIESTVMTIIVLIVCALVSELLYALLLSIFGVNPHLGSSIVLFALPSAAYDSFFACICFPIVKHFIAPMSDRMVSGLHFR